MKVIIQCILIIILAYLLELFLPWWTIAIAAFIGGLAFNTSANFLAGFIAIALLWTVTSLLIELSAAAPLTDRVAQIFKVPKPALFAITALLGGLVGGFAAMTGGALQKDKRKRSY
jgi:hypothetical protein